MNHFKDVCRSSKGSPVHNIEKEDEQEQKTNIETENISSVRFDSNHSTIIANLKKKHHQIKVVITVLYKVDMGSNGNIMPFYMYIQLFPRATMETVSSKNDTKIKLKM